MEQEENKVMRAQLEHLIQIRQEIDRRLQEKEEFENTRKNQAFALLTLWASLEAETRAKAEALRIKKKIETEINELEIAQIRQQGQRRGAQDDQALPDPVQGRGDWLRGVCRQRQEIADRAGLADRRANALQGELEESSLPPGLPREARSRLSWKVVGPGSVSMTSPLLVAVWPMIWRQLESAVHTMPRRD